MNVHETIRISVITNFAEILFFSKKVLQNYQKYFIFLSIIILFGS